MYFCTIFLFYASSGESPSPAVHYLALVPSNVEFTSISKMSTMTAITAFPPRPSRSLQNKVAIVTGSGSGSNSPSEGLGNGRATAILLAEAGANIVCADLSLPSAQHTVSLINAEFGAGRAIAVQADVTSAQDCSNLVQAALDAYGRLDILVNNVGVSGPPGNAVDVDPSAWARGLETNVSSMMLMAKYAVPAMERNDLVEGSIAGRGSIVNIASVAGLLGGVPMLLYPTSKGAVVNMTRAMAVHHAPMGIRVNCVCPGLLYTPMVAGHEMPPEVREARRTGSLLQTEGNAWDCAAAVRFLAGEEARWITGAVLPVDAGMTATLPVLTGAFSTLTADPPS
ncbi:hypothetical protein Hypma_012358 [Hypsizygus marmoreus]|uniref:Uncharacterized protein n=1 Tax=Hypsizygus marmoreus TaxID=39966 RepID=A0A369K6A8_HYPMA|nr:hypothetical protein Hypma_012358 [Hypsizygus marmoreus]